MSIPHVTEIVIEVALLILFSFEIVASLAFVIFAPASFFFYAPVTSFQFNLMLRLHDAFEAFRGFYPGPHRSRAHAQAPAPTVCKCHPTTYLCPFGIIQPANLLFSFCNILLSFLPPQQKSPGTPRASPT
jgi:hypothetical protein